MAAAFILIGKIGVFKMQVLFFALIKKAGPYLAIFGFIFGMGLYCGFRIGSAGLASAKLALSIQQVNDAKAVAQANAAAAADLAKANADADAAEAALAATDKQFSAREVKVTGQIAAQATQPGQDAPDAAVLAQALDALGEAP